MTIQDIVVPSLGLHTGLSAIAYAAARTTGRLEGKDYLWPSGLVINAWYHALIRHVANGVPLSTALKSLTTTDRLVLGGVTLWGGRLFYRIVKRSIQRGRDDPRYDNVKTPSAWTKAFFAKFLPEAVVQTIIGLSWSIPFNGTLISPHFGAPREYAGLLHGAAVGLYTVGLSMEVLADWQLERNKSSNDLQRSGVWSIVRHPKYVPQPEFMIPVLTLLRSYLGDALVHASIPLLLYADNRFHPLTLLGPLANYVFLRYIGGDKENEASQTQRYAEKNPEKLAQLNAYKREKNSFWPAVKDLGNVWSVGLVAGGVAAALAERFARSARMI